MKLFTALPVCCAILPLLISCGGDGDSNGSSEFNLAITDAPVNNAENVFLTVSGITLKGPDGQQSFAIEDQNGDPKQFDLLALRGSTSESLLDGLTLTAGDYQWIRLDVVTSGSQDTYVVLDSSAEHELTLPSELKLNRGFTLLANGSASFTLDVDLQKALVLSAGQYHLKPVMRLVDNQEAGHIEGTIDGSLFSANSCTDISVYAFSGNDVTPIDIQSDSGPLLVAPADTSGSSNVYQLGFLEAGDYTLALACDPVDGPETPDVLEFIDFVDPQNVTVESGETLTKDFI